MGSYTIFEMFENPRRGRQARNFTTNIAKILDLKSSSEQIFSENWRWVPLENGLRNIVIELENTPRAFCLGAYNPYMISILFLPTERVIVAQKNHWSFYTEFVLNAREKQASLARHFGISSVASSRKSSLFGHITNSLLTKLFRSRWLDFGLVIFGVLKYTFHCVFQCQVHLIWLLILFWLETGKSAVT